MSHGGLMGIQEALYYGVPFIGFPLYGDQFLNVDNFVKKNMAIQMDYEKITAEQLIKNLNLILHDPNFK